MGRERSGEWPPPPIHPLISIWSCYRDCFSSEGVYPSHSIRLRYGKVALTSPIPGEGSYSFLEGSAVVTEVVEVDHPDCGEDRERNDEWEERLSHSWKRLLQYFRETWILVPNVVSSQCLPTRTLSPYVVLIVNKQRLKTLSILTT